MTTYLNNLEMGVKGRVYVCSMPWASPEMPSIQVGVLISFLKENGIEAEGRNWFLSVANFLGSTVYNRVIEDYLEDGELLYSYLLFPELREKLSRSSKFADVLGKIVEGGLDLYSTLNNKQIIDDFFQKFDSFHDKLIGDNIHHPLLVGFTLNFGQTLPSLYMSKKVKEIWPDCKVIFGGAEATGELGKSLLENFNFVDYACNGEGELMLTELSKKLTEGIAVDEKNIKGLIFRNINNQVIINSPNQLQNLHTLPIPDYDDYFQQIEMLGSDKLKFQASIAIPVETSRGCPFDCSFCALNIQWDGTRRVSPNGLKEMITYLSQRHEILDFFFVDNLIPSNAVNLFEKLKEDQLDIHFFYEMRADLPISKLTELKRIGLSRVQVGVEALSNSILKKFHKKTSVMQNILTLKNLEQLGIQVSFNLIVEHPNITQKEVDESVEIIQKMFAFPPPTALAQFCLQYGSPDYYSSCEKSLSITGNFKSYKILYPQELFRNLELPRKDFHIHTQEVDISEFRSAVMEWQNRYNNFKSSHGKRELILKIYDGNSFAIIEDKRNVSPEKIVLNKIERDVIVYSSQPVLRSSLIEKLAGYTAREIDETLRELSSLNLIYCEDGLILSLPMRELN